MPAIE